MSNRATIDEQINDSKDGVAILVTCLVQELDRLHPGFQDSYLARLSKAYAEVREKDTDALDRLELISWTRQMLTGFSPVTGQGKPFLDDR